MQQSRFRATSSERQRALKGKGVELAQWHQESVARLDAIKGRLEALAQSTTDIDGWRWCLTLHTSARGAWRLRWRTNSWRTVPWHAIERDLLTLPPTLAQWYRETNVGATVLNHREQAARYELNTVLRLAAAMGTRSLAGKVSVARF